MSNKHRAVKDSEPCIYPECLSNSTYPREGCGCVPGHKIIIDVYVQGSKEAMYEKGEEMGLEGDALSMFSRTACEVKLTIAVNPETGESKYLAIDDRKISDQEFLGQPELLIDCHFCKARKVRSAMSEVDIMIRKPYGTMDMDTLYLCAECVKRFGKKGDL